VNTATLNHISRDASSHVIPKEVR